MATLISVMKIRVNENGLHYPGAACEMVERALGDEGFYGIFTMHDDFTDGGAFLDAIVSVAKSRNIPIVSARQVLTWLDAREASSFQNFSWRGNELSFSVSTVPEAVGLKGMLPLNSADHSLTTLLRDRAGRKRFSIRPSTLRPKPSTSHPTRRQMETMPSPKVVLRRNSFERGDSHER